MAGGMGLFANVCSYRLRIMKIRAAFGGAFASSTVVTGVVFVATLLIWKERPGRLRSDEPA